MRRLPFVSIIVPTYNRNKLLTSTVESLLNMDYPGNLFEIIICDNNSNDSTRDVVEAFKGRTSIPVIYLFEKRQGAHFARNSAAKVAKGEILYFTDDDMIADPMLLNELIEAFNTNPMIGCATGKIMPKFVSPPPRWITSKYLNNAHFGLTGAERTEELIVSRDLMVFSGHQAVRREVFIEAGGFNPDYFSVSGMWVGDGETGLNAKIKAMGYLFAYTASSLTYHIILPNRMTLKYLINRIGYEGYCESYTDYRKHRRRDLIIPKMIRRNTIELVIRFAKITVKIALGILSWRFFPAYVIYFHNQNRFDLKLLRDASFRRIVEIDNWLTVDQGGEFLKV